MTQDDQSISTCVSGGSMIRGNGEFATMQHFIVRIRAAGLCYIAQVILAFTTRRNRGGQYAQSWRVFGDHHGVWNIPGGTRDIINQSMYSAL